MKQSMTKTAISLRRRRATHKGWSTKKNNIWIKKHPIARLAHKFVEGALYYGIIIRKPCRKCGNKKSQAHHDDYSKPLQIKWMCQKCHSEHHAKKKVH